MGHHDNVILIVCVQEGNKGTGLFVFSSQEQPFVKKQISEVLKTMHFKILDLIRGLVGGLVFLFISPASSFLFLLPTSSFTLFFLLLTPSSIFIVPIVSVFLVLFSSSSISSSVSSCSWPSYSSFYFNFLLFVFFLSSFPAYSSLFSS